MGQGQMQMCQRMQRIYTKSNNMLLDKAGGKKVNMDKRLGTFSYGICLFSVEVLQDFLKKEKIRSKKLLEKFQKNKDLYLTTQKEGIWIPIVQIDSGGYVIKLDGYDEPFNDEWEQKLEYDGFNIEIKDTLCI